jgi:hypothetical protein
MAFSQRDAVVDEVKDHPAKIDRKEDNKVNQELQKQIIVSLQKQLDDKLDTLIQMEPKKHVVIKYVKRLVPVYIPIIDSENYSSIGDPLYDSVPKRKKGFLKRMLRK